MVLGMKAIEKRVRDMEKAALKDITEGMPILKKYVESEIVFSVAWSPRLGAYDTDFGWGKPIKTEVVQIDSRDLFSLGESRDENGGIEVGLALSSAHMTRFVVVWEQNLKLFGCS